MNLRFMNSYFQTHNWYHPAALRNCDSVMKFSFLEIAEAAVHRFLQKICKFLMKKSVSKYYFNKVEDLKAKPLSKRKYGAGVLYKSFS